LLHNRGEGSSPAVTFFPLCTEHLCMVCRITPFMFIAVNLPINSTFRCTYGLSD
jgi:hypothetical protein